MTNGWDIRPRRCGGDIVISSQTSSTRPLTASLRLAHRRHNSTSVTHRDRQQTLVLNSLKFLVRDAPLIVGPATTVGLISVDTFQPAPFTNRVRYLEVRSTPPRRPTVAHRAESGAIVLNSALLVSAEFSPHPWSTRFPRLPLLFGLAPTSIRNPCRGATGVLPSSLLVAFITASVCEEAVTKIHRSE